jgi:hypothetical protein
MNRMSQPSPKLQSRAAEKPDAIPQTFARPVDRTRLTPTALKAIRSLATAWRLTGDDAAALVGVSPSTWDRISANAWKQTLTQDQLTRISALVGIFKGLHLLFADDMADRWPRLANSGPLFQNLTPIAAMQHGGIPLMLDVRQHVDALRGGV